MAKSVEVARRRRNHSESDYRRRFEILFSITRSVSGRDSLDEILDALVELTSREVGCERSSFLLNDPESGELYSRAAQGMTRR